MIEVIAMASLLTIILCFAWYKTNSLFKAFVIMLIIGKVITGIFWAFGYDKTLFTITVMNRRLGVPLYQFHISACMVVFLSFLLTLIGALSFPYIVKYLPYEIRSGLRRFEVRGA